MKPSCDSPDFDPAWDFTRRHDRLKMFVMITKILTNYYFLTKELGCFRVILGQLESKGCFA